MQTSPLAFLGRDASEQSQAKKAIHPASEKEETSAGAVGRAKTNRKIRGEFISKTPVKLQFTHMRHYSLSSKKLLDVSSDLEGKKEL